MDDHNAQARQAMINDITTSLIKTTKSLRQLNTNLSTIAQRGEKIAAVSAAWSELVSQSKQ
jgi:hypothetical protein